ncbi:MAG: IPT/TIG domain-containing protein [Patescibacteria group bacterium]
MNIKRLKQLALGSLVALSAVSSLAFAVPAFAQTSDVQTGLTTVGDATGLGNTDPKIIVARIIRTAISFLGVVAVVIVLYGGFVWMTAAGDEKKVGRAKKILIGGAIGLVIILLSWSIVSFILSALLSATGAGGAGGGGGGAGGGGGGIGGTGGASELLVTGISPAGTITIQNALVRVTFSKSIDPASMNGQLKIVNSTTNVEVPGVSSVAGNTITFHPDAPCATPNETRFCFDASTAYSISVLPTLKSTAGLTLTCSTAKPCTGGFTSGAVVDTKNPVAHMTLPDNNQTVPADSTQPVQVQATDDAGVASAGFLVGDVLFDEVTATGADLKSVTIDDLWDTAGLENGKSYRVSAQVSDLAGNTDTDAVTVRVKPASCFNGILDTGSGETGIDCGGDALSPNFCGACSGGACTANADCGSGLCEAGRCVENPVINAVSPDSGAPGTYVTIAGTGFGSSAGKVSFTGANGPVEAVVAPCGGAWTDREIIVIVPATTVSGLITVTASGGTRKDDTANDHGPVLPNFAVNTVIHPNLCSLDKNSVSPTNSLGLIGDNFGANRGTSTVNFGTQGSAGSYSAWTNSSIMTTVPQMPNGTFPVSVSVNGISSNALSLRVASTVSTTGTLPSIATLSPATGGIGRYVTLDGANFGASKGTVKFVNRATGDSAIGSIDFPTACSAINPWTNNQIRFIVPAKYTSAVALAVGVYDVSVTTSSSQSSNTVPFTVTADDSAPNVCGVIPGTGAVGDTVSLVGNQFGTATGTVTFADGAQTNIASWSPTEIKVPVPSAAKTGAVKLVSSTGTKGNDTFFEVTSGVSAGAGSTAGYAWSFSTGAIPHVPQLVTECSADRVSAVPNNKFTDLVCTNAVVYAEFTEAMNEGTLNDAVKVDRCTGQGTNPCSAVISASGTLRTTPTSFTFIPGASLAVSSTYRVTVTTVAVSTGGAGLARDVSWTFVTQATSAPCTIDSVRVTPAKGVITLLGGTKSFSAVPTAGCVPVDSASYSWSWDASPSITRFNSAANPACVGGASACTTVEALAEGETPVTASETGSDIKSAGNLAINFLDPYVTGTWPACDSACPNAQVGGTFNIPMNSSSVERVGAVKLFSCANELCTSVTEIGGVRASCVTVTGAQGLCTGFTLGNLALTPGTFYRAVISGSVTSESGVRLIQTNDGGDYSWTFRAREDGSACAVDRVALAPSAITLRSTGDRASFSSSAFGAADSCSASGQRLTGFSYSWAWTDPIKDQNIDNDSSTRVAEWLGGTMVDTSPSSVSTSCTASCTSKGSVAYSAICGDGTADALAGEECEDGNVANGDGCSSSCLREGNSTAGTTCGNGRVERSSSGAGEDCDDGNKADGDGCSSLCLAEGSRFVGATCGNHDIAADTTTKAGEECDDGNAKNGDGCSSQCLNEGTPTLASIGGAVCGDDRTDKPAENCDDGNIVNGDGCSSSCLLEGSSSRYTAPSVCGDIIPGTGEECEDGNRISGDGCSSTCLLEGSSAQYLVPSYCGDGNLGAGENYSCEVSAGGDGRIDPTQTAVVRDDAVFEVDAVTRMANASIEVKESSSGLSTTASLSLACSASSDRDCRDPRLNGAGTNNCCSLRPTAVPYPSSGTSVCLNQSLYAVFNQKMDTSSFTFKETAGAITTEKYRMYLSFHSLTAGACPSGYTYLAHDPKNIFAQARNAFVRFLTGASAEAAPNTGVACVLPIDGFDQVPQADGTYRVYLRYSKPLVPNTTYMLVVKGDEDISDAVTDGVRSATGVGMSGTVSSVFMTGPSLCSLDAVQVLDTNKKSPNAFTRGDDVHTFKTSALSYVGNATREIESLPGTYAWDYTAWAPANADLFTATRSATQHDLADVAVKGKNGRSTLLAEATITTDALGSTTGTPREKVVSGTAPLIAFLCENPWPELSKFPWEDTARGGANGLASQGANGWMNFSTYYCRDAGIAGVSDDLPGMTVVRPPVSQAGGVIKEYLFETADGSGDAIGVRVLSNPDYLSPRAWYTAQNFKGTPQETTIDGFLAVKDGRSTYVAAPNLGANVLYDNIYVISYNDGASDTTKKIADALLSSFAFASNMNDVTLCTVNGAVTSASCSADSDCPLSPISPRACSSVKAKVRRDIRRLSDMTDLRTEIKKYGTQNGVCSGTGAQLCSTGGECPGTESCIPIVPELSAGTFVRSIAVSPWPSWSDILGGALEMKDIAQDPLNVFSKNSCGNAGGPFVSFDSATCVDQSKGAYVCPVNSHVYHYIATGNRSARITADLEYSAQWGSPIDTDGPADRVDVLIGGAANTGNGFIPASYCVGVTYGTSASCGDGVIGGGETCELGQHGGLVVACDGNNDGVNDGFRSQVCNASCTAFVPDSGSACVSNACGNGLKEGAEECDDGAQNGKYGFCGFDCTRASGFSCGDGSLAGSEKCDCGSTPPLIGRRAFGGGICGGLNGVYQSSATSSCAWDCSGPASYCGDTKVDAGNGEVCDGNTDSYQGKLCTPGATKTGAPCTTDADCGSGGTCGMTALGPYAWADACPLSTVCTAGDPAKLGHICAQNSSCGTDGICSAQTYQTSRIRACGNGSNGTACQWVTPNYRFIKCTALSACGNGKKEGSEECDDGNTDSSDSCTNSCKTNVCGDGAYYVGVEECDLGVQNGQSCSSTYGSTCTACSVSCRNVVSSGAFCGDGVRNGTEFCDGSDVQLTYYDAGTGKTAGSCSTPTGFTTVGQDLYHCADLGICNGGPRNGEYCTNTTISSIPYDMTVCGTGIACVKPKCSNSCASACPFSFSTNPTLLLPNLPGSRASSSVELNSYSSSSTSLLPNAATLTIPACTLVGQLTGTVSMNNVTPPEVNIVFVTDRSGSMDWDFAGRSLYKADGVTINQNYVDPSRINAVKASLATAVNSVFTAFGEHAHISLVGFSGIAGTGMCTNPRPHNDLYNQSCDGVVDGECGAGGICTAKMQSQTVCTFGFCGKDAKTTLTSRINAYDAKAQNGTQTGLGLLSAKGLLDALPNASNTRNIIILLSDGQPEGTADALSVTNDAADSIKASQRDYEIYTVALTDTYSLIENMKKWSSNSFSLRTGPLETNTSNGVDYAYDAHTPTELASAYDGIIKSITGITVSLLSADANNTVVASSVVLHEGAGQVLPWPEFLKCDGVHEQQVPIHVSFGGTGQITISDVRLNYCAP